MSSKEQAHICAAKKHKNVRRFFTDEEDKIIMKIMYSTGTRNWKLVSTHLPGRHPKQCRDRWLNYLAPWIKRGNWTIDEDELIKKSVKEIGTKWTRIQKILPGRTENDIKNRWYTYLSNKNEENPLLIDFLKEIEIESTDFDISFFLS
jgi:hypothetical protein